MLKISLHQNGMGLVGAKAVAGMLRTNTTLTAMRYERFYAICEPDFESMSYFNAHRVDFGFFLIFLFFYYKKNPQSV